MKLPDIPEYFMESTWIYHQPRKEEYESRLCNYVQQATLKAVVEWGDEFCEHPAHIGYFYHKRDCGLCWLELKKLIKERE